MTGTRVSRSFAALERHLGSFCRQDQAQDLTEYAFLLAFVCLFVAAIFSSMGNSIIGIWSGGNARLSQVNGAIQ